MGTRARERGARKTDAARGRRETPHRYFVKTSLFARSEGADFAPLPVSASAFFLGTKPGVKPVATAVSAPSTSIGAAAPAADPSAM